MLRESQNYAPESSDSGAFSLVANLNQIYYTYSSFRPYQIIRKDGSNVSQTYQFGYDDYGNVASLKVGSKTLAQYAYGANNGPLSTLTYGNGDTVNYTYDQYGRLLKEIQDDGSTMTYTYNGEGMLYSAAESGAGRNIRTVYTYDTLDRLIYKDFVKGTTSSLRYSAGYNNKNQLVTRGWATNGLNYQENFTYNSTDGTLNTMTIDTDATTGVEHTFQLYYDDLRRLLTVGRGVYNFSYTYKDISDTQTTNQITDLWYTGAAGNIGFHYTYDALGNIATYQEPGGTFTYTYDAQGQLTKAVKGNTTYNYSYDSVGNILTANGHTYTYGNADWKDLLTAYDGQSITYDGSGNPTSYYNGTRWTFGWTNGRSLTSASNGSTSATYTYNLDGSRASKTVDGVPHYYLWQDGKPIKEYVDGNSDIFDRYDTLYFLYDENGRPFALIFNGTTYYYVLNLQGDVMRLVTADGTIVAEYTYDPYGNILTATGDLAHINPLRYRGYYYDTELGMYFLNSRYYDPKIGRFVNADDYVSTGQGVLGNNMFAYCGNNPTARKDPDGDAFETAFDIISLGISVADVIANPSDPWAWAGFAGDLIDVAIPFVGGVGETAKAMSFAAKGADAVDDVYDASKAADFAGGLCFVAGTQVLTGNGYRTIETIQAGDYVWAWDEVTGDTALKQVVETYVNETYELVHVFVNGQEIAATPGHPFYSPVKGWTEAVRLRAGDILVLVNGEYVVVEKVQHEILETPVTVYNFQVEDYHTYYVSECGVLVHNSCSSNINKNVNISTGRSAPNNLTEKLAMESVKSNPQSGREIIHTLKDTRFPADYSKFQQSFNTSKGRITIHYVGNRARNVFEDFKFKP